MNKNVYKSSIKFFPYSHLHHLILQYKLQFQMPTYIPPQSFFIYEEPWTFDLDAHLLLALTHLKETYQWEGEFIPQVAINEASKILARENAVQLTCDELSTRLQVLKQRYDTFNEVVATNGATWVVKHEIVVASEEVWSEILKVSIYITYLHIFLFACKSSLTLSCLFSIIERPIRRGLLPSR